MPRMSDLMLHRVRDRPPTAAEVARDLHRLYPERGGVLAGAQRDGVFCAFVVALCDPDDQYAPNIFDGAQAEREWHQRDHILTGFGLSQLEPDSHWEALASAKRGKLEQYRLCVWYDRGSWPLFKQRYRIFRRAPRFPPHYRPAGIELSAEELRSIFEHT